MAKKKETWPYSTGEKGRNRVRAFEDNKSGIILLEFYEPVLGGEAKRKRISTGHRDRARAKQQADELAAAFGRNEPPPSEELNLRELFDMYLGEVTPTKGKSKQQHDHRCAEMFLRIFGAGCRPHTLSRRDWDRFIRERQQGRIAPLGIGKKDRSLDWRRETTVRNRVIAYDLKWLVAVLNWATLSRDEQGSILLAHNPLKGLPVPKEESPRRPVLTHERYESMRKAAREMGWRFECMLVLVHETGHRVGSVRQLRWSDVDLSRGVIRWQAENDKIGFEHVTPLTAEARAALERARGENPGIGDVWIFPAHQNAAKPTDRSVVKNWWVRAEKRAKLPPINGLGWHSLRRKFATEMKDNPLRDLCELGGWKSPVTVLTCYQQPEEERMRAAQANRTRYGATGTE